MKRALSLLAALVLFTQTATAQTIGPPPAVSAIKNSAALVLDGARVAQQTSNDDVGALTESIGSAYACTTIPSPVSINLASAAIVPVGGNYQQAGPTFCTVAYQGAVADIGGGSSYGVQGQTYRFATDSQIFDFGFYGLKYRARYKEIGGTWKWMSTTDITMPTAFDPYYVKYTFPTLKPRIIEITIPDAAILYEINISTGYKFWAPSLPQQPRLLIVSDSYGRSAINGSAYTTLNQGGFAAQIGVALNGNVISSSLGGTGYVNAGATQNLLQRITDISRFGDVNVVGVAMGANDNAIAPATLTAQVSSIVAQIKARQPNAIIVGFGPWKQSSLNTSTATNDAIAAGWAPYLDNRTFYHDLITTSVVPLVGTEIGTDSAHPSDIGYSVLARRLSDLIIADSLIAVGQ